MADFRQIKCAMWREDDWFLDLPTDGKMFWIYLFSNPSASVAGIYRLSLRTMANETGLSQQRIAELLTVFSDANKAHFADGVIWVVKMREHQATTSGKVKTRIDKDIASLPADNTVYRMYAQKYGIDTVSIPIHTETETDTDTETDTGSSSVVDPVLVETVKAYESHIGIVSSADSESLKEISASYPADWTVRAIELAKGKRSPMPYIRTVLQNWQRGDGAPPPNGQRPRLIPAQEPQA